MGIVIGVFDKGLNDLRELVALAGVKFAVFNFVETLKHFAFFCSVADQSSQSSGNGAYGRS